MYFSKALVYILWLMTLISSGVTFPTKMRPKREQYGLNWDGNREDIVELDPSQDKDVTHFPTDEYVETSEKYTSTEVTNSESQYQHSYDRRLYRNKRKFYPYLPYTNNGMQLQSRNLWRPTEYPLQQPYHIPVYGKEGSTPVYINPHPMLVNAEDLPQNSEKLPADEDVDLSSPSTYFPFVVSHAQDSENDEPFSIQIDDKPIWGTTEMTEPTEFDQMPGFPVVEDDSVDLEYDQFVSPTIDRPRTEPSLRLPRSPNNCVLAIVSCCSVASSEVNSNCFEQFGCAGPFWDINPCKKEFVTVAVEKAITFYSSLRNKTEHPE